MARPDRSERRFAGETVAALLAGSWRDPLPPLEFSEHDLNTVAPLLRGAGATGLAWRRLRDSPVAYSPAGQQLRDCYRAQSLRTAVQERTLVRVVAALRDVGIEPVVFKGWATARLYPEPGLRPYGDIDLAVPPRQVAAAVSVIADMELQGEIDLLDRFEEGRCGRPEGLFERSLLVTLGGTEIRVLSPEDHLRVLCLHLLRHSAWRSVWLCDVALAVESRPADFDWRRCLGPHRPESDWVASAIALAHQLLGARVDDTPMADRARCLPTWLSRYVLTRWGGPPPGFFRPLGGAFASPREARRALSLRMTSPLEATVRLRAPLNRFPRWPLQVAETARRAFAFLAHLPGRW